MIHSICTHRSTYKQTLGNKVEICTHTLQIKVDGSAKVGPEGMCPTIFWWLDNIVPPLFEEGFCDVPHHHFTPSDTPVFNLEVDVLSYNLRTIGTFRLHRFLKNHII